MNENVGSRLYQLTQFQTPSPAFVKERVFFPVAGKNATRDREYCCQAVIALLLS